MENRGYENHFQEAGNKAGQGAISYTHTYKIPQPNFTLSIKTMPTGILPNCLIHLSRPLFPKLLS